MSLYCPVCNGLQALQAACPSCAHQAVDYGRLDDYAGPYEPYRQQLHEDLTNGFADVRNQECMHCVYCESCGKSYAVGVSQWNGNFSFN